MSLVKTSLLNAIAVAIKVTTSLVLNKVLAVHLGPSGYAVIGQFQNLLAMVVAVASGSVGVGVTKYTAEYADEPERQHLVWRTAALISLVGGSCCIVVLVIARHELAQWALADPALSDVILWLAGALFLILLNTLLLAILNGKKAVRAYVLANIAGSLLTALMAGALVTWCGLQGALVAVATGQAVACLATVVLFAHALPQSWSALAPAFDRQAMGRLAHFAVMSITSAVVVPLAQLLIRDGIADRLGWHDAGLWQAVWRVSDIHLMLLTTTLSLYFLPRFSEIRRNDELLAEVKSGMRLVLPLVLTSALSIYLLRGWLIPTLLTDSFLPLVDVIGWQLIGDIAKVCSWVVAYTLISRARTTVYVGLEIAFSALLVALSLAGTNFDGLRGSAVGYAATYVLYGCAVLFFFRRMLRQEPGSEVSRVQPTNKT
ncbi:MULTISPECIES: O-antigen translocase [unclassified Rhizobacter]|uniref:O-antigen translocase n=1 Tax=unclassified Rhizobacter TaxID=2640088 RepID=UPI0006FED14F|nr:MULTISPECIES: O-antigen translocase [unclassified Rhizobacter]KQU74861.1 hypothetical protein ASC88_25930 [Rhizobacter sp. Root29]KQW01064.1 hypothetical protein ASC98_07035 [Rhizobacter sp. Root1238]KRB03914.1 hypothetical protein ASE08_14540 [Rhizobacter sp. Root16D2]